MMAADLYIHVIPHEPVEAVCYSKDRLITYTGIVDETVLATFFSHTLGSKWCTSNNYDRATEERAYWLVSRTPNVRVGEVSWLKADLLGSPEEFVPAPIQAIGEGLPIINDELIEKINDALQLENKTSYTLNDTSVIIEFLKVHKGLRCFTVYW